jgi:sugar phosphate isomerase/epimerase
MPTIRRRLAAAACAAGLCGLALPHAQAPRIEVGVCTPLRNLAAARAAGFDYAELGTTEIAALSDEAFERSLAEVGRIGLPVPVTNLFLPAALKVTGPAVNPAEQTTYVAKAFSRLERLGTSTVVFGSGGARRVPDGFPQDEAVRQLVEFGRRIAPVAAAHGITVAIEPLRRQETNIINTAAEGLELVEAIGHPNFQLMIDFYHLSIEQESVGVVARAGSRLRHLHMANPQGRVYPLAWSEYDYAPFFTELRRTGYARRISIEGSASEFAVQAPQAIALLRHAFSQRP